MFPRLDRVGPRQCLDAPSDRPFPFAKGSGLRSRETDAPRFRGRVISQEDLTFVRPGQTKVPFAQS